jgi:hypothetical protein
VLGHAEVNRLFESKSPHLPRNLLPGPKLRLHGQHNLAVPFDNRPDLIEKAMVGVELMLRKAVTLEMRVDESPEVVFRESTVVEIVLRESEALCLFELLH